MKKPLSIYILFLPLFLILYFSIYYQSLPNDAIQYSTLGYNLLHNGVYEDPYGVVPGWIQSPGWPLVTGFCSLILPQKIASLIAGILIGIAILLVLFFFLNKTFNRDIALLSVVLLSLNPQFLISSRSALSEPLYALIHLLLFILSYRIIFEKQQITYRSIILLSIVSAALMLTRAEGILYILLIPFLLLIFHQQPARSGLAENQKQPLIYIRIPDYLKRFYRPLLFLVLTILLLIPYGNWIKKQSGDFNLLPKITFNKRIGSVASVLKEKKDLYLSDQESFQELVWFGLDTSAYSLYAENILNDEYYEKMKQQFQPQEQSFVPFLKLLGKNIVESIRVAILSNPFPVIFLILILLGIFYFFKQKRKMLWFLLFWLAPSFYFLISHVEERFFYVMLPYLSLLAAYGIYQFGQRVNKGELIKNIALLLLILNSSFYYKDYLHKLEENQAYYQAALVLKNTIPTETAVCAKNFSVTFYSNNHFIKMPVCSISDLKKYMEKQKVTFLLLGKEINKTRKAFQPIFQNAESTGFKPVKEIKTEHQFFKLVKLPK